MADYKPMYKTQVAIMLRLDAAEDPDNAVAMAKIAGTYNSGYYPEMVEAYARDYFAVHHSVTRYSSWDREHEWTLTHVPTGHKVIGSFRTKRQAAMALDFIVEKSREISLEWTFTNIDDSSSHKRRREFQDLVSDAREYSRDK